MILVVAVAPLINLMDLARVFIGFDQDEAVAAHVLQQSILETSQRSVAVTLLSSSLIPEYTRKRLAAEQSNDFTFTRFLVPFLCGYKGWAIYMDCDMLARDDLYKLWNLRDPDKAVQVVQHPYIESEDSTKYLNRRQQNYSRKNWSSLTLFNNNRCTALTADFVNTATKMDLHQFAWLSSDNHIGALPESWNHLVGIKQFDPEAKVVHWTIGGPYFDEYCLADYADEWYKCRDRMQAVTQAEVKQAIGG